MLQNLASAAYQEFLTPLALLHRLGDRVNESGTSPLDLFRQYVIQLLKLSTRQLIRFRHQIQFFGTVL
jgi:hypothetical protein